MCKVREHVKDWCIKSYQYCVSPDKGNFVLILLAFAVGILLVHVQNIVNQSLQIFDAKGISIKWLWDKSWEYLQGTIVGIVIVVAIAIALILWFGRIKGNDAHIIDKLEEINKKLDGLPEKIAEAIKRAQNDKRL